MKIAEIHIGRVYEGPAGKKLRVLAIHGTGSRAKVKIRTSSMVPYYQPLGKFAAWAVKDVTLAPVTALVGGTR